MNCGRLLFLFCFLLEFGCFGQTSISGGSVSGTWTKAGSPYIILGDVTIPPGENLSLEPGVIVFFSGYYKLTVNGSLLARGTPADSIVIDRKDANSSWHSIRIEGVSPGIDSTIFEYCRIEHAQYPGGDVTLNGGNAVLVNNFHKVRISHCLIRNNSGGRGAGIYATNANIKVSNNTIRKNVATQLGGGIYVDGGKVQLTNNLIESNYAGDRGGGIYLNATAFSAPAGMIDRNTISYNHSYWTGGGIWIAANATVSGNLITYNESDHDDGGGMYVALSPKVINNTIAFNRGERGEGIFSGGNSQFINNIIYYNISRGGTNEDDEIYLFGGSPSFFHCNIQAGIAGIVHQNGTYNGVTKRNFDAPPLFKNPALNDMRLSWNNFPTLDGTQSPCIDVGTPDAPHDPDGTTADVGARYFHQSGVNAPPLANFEADTLVGYSSLTVQFRDLSFSGSSAINEWHWDFGDGSTSTQQHPPHLYNTAGMFNVTLTVKAGNGVQHGITKKQYIHILAGEYIKGKILGTFTAPRYIVGGDLLVEETKLLTVTPGVEFVFLGPYKFEVLGALKARGTAQQPIVFTTYDTETPTRWKGLYLYASGPQDSTIIDHCKVQYVENNGFGAIMAFSENGAAGMRISNNEICYNSTQGIQVSTSKVIVRNNYIHHNTARLFQDGAGIYIPAGSPKIINNIIAYNETPGSGGGICVDWSGQPFLINNTITNNKAYRGGGIADGAGWFESINNTIAFNTATEGGGYYAIYGGDVTFTNTIITNNMGGQVRIADPYSRVGFRNSFLQDGSSGVLGYGGSIFLYENVLTSDPLLATGTNRHGKLLPGSPALDAGTSIIAAQLPTYDILGNPRIVNSSVDIGAYEYAADAPLSNLNPIADINVEEDFLPFIIPLDAALNNLSNPNFLTVRVDPLVNPLLNATIRNQEIHVSSMTDKFGEQPVVVNVSDGTTSVTTTFIIHIAAVDDPPLFTTEDHVLVDEDFVGPRPYQINTTPPYGEENQSRVYSLLPQNSDLVDIQFNPNGMLAFTPKANRYGSQRFTLTLSEGQQTYSEQFNFTVKPVNDAPTIMVDIDSVAIDPKDSVFVLVTVSDIEGDPVSFTGYLDNYNISVYAAQFSALEYVLLVIGERFGKSRITMVATDGMLTTEMTIPVTITIVTGVDDRVPTVNAYPNPTPGPVTVTGRERSSITLYSTNGQEILRSTMSTTESTLDLTSFKPGLYLLLVDDGHRRHVFKIVRQ